MVDMALTPEDKEKNALACTPCGVDQPDYPYGLSISLDETSLAKLGLDADCEVGDLIHLNTIGKVTSISKNSSDSGSRSNVSIQLMYIGLENESHESADEEPDEMPLEKHGYMRYK
jgi:hypothetical protein